MTHPRVTLLRPDGTETVDDTEFPHEQLDVHDVLESAYRIVVSWQGVSWSRGTPGDQLKRALTGAVLRYTEGLSYPEIARVLNIPPGTVAGRLHKAHGILRRKLKGVFHDNVDLSPDPARH